VLFHEQFCNTVVNVTDVWKYMMLLFDGLTHRCTSLQLRFRRKIVEQLMNPQVLSISPIHLEMDLGFFNNVS
jgi:hypothetical protein